MSTNLVPGEDDDVVELTPIAPTPRPDDSGRLNELLAVLSLIAFVWNMLRED